MKKHILLFIAFFIGMTTTNATVYTVSNDPDNPAQFDNFTEAHAAASPGDTLYVFGSPISYGNVDITKQLTIIGAGYNPENQYDYSTIFGTIKLAWLSVSENSSGTNIMGVKASLSNANNIENVTIMYSDIAISVSWSTGGPISYSYPSIAYNWLIKNNIIRGISSGNLVHNFIITNNIINGSISGFIEPSIILCNNTFVFGDVFYQKAFDNISHTSFLNNIFYDTNVTETTCLAENCIFNNNLSYLGDYTTFITGECNNSGSGNLENIDPQFISVASTTFSYDDDYRLQLGSPCINAGTDGTDIGITGGEYPWPREADGTLDLTGMPPIPQIIEMNILNPVIPEDGTLTIKVKAHN